MGRLDEALETIGHALELDPLSLPINRDVGSIFYFAGQHDQAIKALQKTIEMDPSFSYVHLLLGSVYLQKGMHAEAIAECEKETNVTDLLDAVIGVTYAITGKKDKAREIIEKSKNTYVPPYLLAVLTFALGENDHAFELLNRGYEERDPWMRLIKIHPTLDLFDVRSDPRYAALLKKMNLDK
jgi:tetratricopeptide (TPR) repeat protein